MPSTASLLNVTARKDASSSLLKVALSTQESKVGPVQGRNKGDVWAHFRPWAETTPYHRGKRRGRSMYRKAASL